MSAPVPLSDPQVALVQMLFVQHTAALRGACRGSKIDSAYFAQARSRLGIPAEI